MFARARSVLCRAALVALALAFVAGCGDDDSTPPPDSITVGPVTIETDPLRLVVDAPGGDFSAMHFVEVARADNPDITKYYDPLDPGDVSIEWIPATRATSQRADGTLELDNGATLRLGEGPLGGTATVTLDVTAAQDDRVVLVRLATPRAAGEAIFGFGESFESAVPDGAVREMQFRVEASFESALNEAHVPVPLSLWPGHGVGLFVEDPRPGAFDIGAARADRVLATFTRTAKGPLAAHFFTAADPLELSRTYAQLTALPAVPPRWAFAPQQWRNEHDNRDQVTDDANQMRALDIPGSVMWIDNPWQTGYNTFEFDETRFAQSAALIDELTALGYRVLVWSTPYVNTDGPTAADFAEARAADLLVKDDLSRVIVWPWQDGPGALVDFTHPDAPAFWQQRIARAVDLGIDGFKLDFGEDVVPEFFGTATQFELFAGTSQTLHNAYATEYHRTYLDALPPGDGFLITRAGSYGGQAVNTCIWPGDLDNDFSLHGVDNGEGERNVGGLPAAVAGNLSLSVSGYPFFGSDIGGFRNGVPTTEVLVRWAQHAALGTVMQLGGGGRSHNPWDTTLFDAEALPIYRTYARLHMALFPYLYDLALTAGADGTPVLRPCRFVHPDAACDDASYFVGPDLFVAPVITEGATTRAVVLPPGEWIDHWTGAVVVGDGRTEVTADAPLDILPLWRRRNAMLPLYARDADTLEPATAGGVTSYSDPAFGRELRLVIAPDGTAADVSVLGFTAQASASATEYRVELSPSAEFHNVTLEFDLRAGQMAPLSDPISLAFDGTALGTVVTEDALEVCGAPGCYLRIPAEGRLLVRVVTDGTGNHAVVIE